MYALERIYGQYSQEKQGPLFVVVGGIHGNEWAGVKAIDLMLKMLEVEPITNKNFTYYGTFVGVLGNLAALSERIRYKTIDLNRIWNSDILDMVRHQEIKDLNDEFYELYDLSECLHHLINSSPHKKVIILDLHTTTADGGIFSFPFNGDEGLGIARAIKAPIIFGIQKQLIGTMIGYLDRFSKQLFPNKEVEAIVFESGQHYDPLSTNRAIAAMISCMKHIGAVEEKDIEYAHEAILAENSAGLPEISRVVYCHKISPEDHFEMVPGFKNFDPVSKGQVLAKDKNGIIRAQYDGLLLMPLYQKIGEDGFLIIEEENSTVIT